MSRPASQRPPKAKAASGSFYIRQAVLRVPWLLVPAMFFCFLTTGVLPSVASHFVEDLLKSHVAARPRSVTVRPYSTCSTNSSPCVRSRKLIKYPAGWVCRGLCIKFVYILAMGEFRSSQHSNSPSSLICSRRAPVVKTVVHHVLSILLQIISGPPSSVMPRPGEKIFLRRVRWTSRIPETRVEGVRRWRCERETFALLLSRATRLSRKNVRTTFVPFDSAFPQKCPNMCIELFICHMQLPWEGLYTSQLLLAATRTIMSVYTRAFAPRFPQVLY